MSKPRIAIVIGSTRETRFADKPTAWLKEKAEAHGQLDVEIVDVRDFDLPLFNEAASELWMPSEDPAAQAWQSRIAEFDGYIFMVAEYNHSVTGALKNALDQAYTQWMRKPFSAMGYGGLGAARAVEHLRGIGSELHMAPLRHAVHLAGPQFMKVHPLGENAEMSEVDEALMPAVTAMLDDLTWWAEALRSARAETARKAA